MILLLRRLVLPFHKSARSRIQNTCTFLFYLVLVVVKKKKKIRTRNNNHKNKYRSNGKGGRKHQITSGRRICGSLPNNICFVASLHTFDFGGVGDTLEMMANVMVHRQHRIYYLHLFFFLVLRYNILDGVFAFLLHFYNNLCLFVCVWA